MEPRAQSATTKGDAPPPALSHAFQCNPKPKRTRFLSLSMNKNKGNKNHPGKRLYTIYLCTRRRRRKCCRAACAARCWLLVLSLSSMFDGTFFSFLLLRRFLLLLSESRLRLRLRRGRRILSCHCFISEEAVCQEGRSFEGVQNGEACEHRRRQPLVA